MAEALFPTAVMPCAVGKCVVGITTGAVDAAVAAGVIVEDVAARGGRNIFLGTDTHPPFSPSLERANSKINLPSEKKT